MSAYLEFAELLCVVWHVAFLVIIDKGGQVWRYRGAGCILGGRSKHAEVCAVQNPLRLDVLARQEPVSLCRSVHHLKGMVAFRMKGRQMVDRVEMRWMVRNPADCRNWSSAMQANTLKVYGC